MPLVTLGNLPFGGRHIFMKYHAPSNQLTIAPQDLQAASRSMLWAILSIRQSAGLDPKGYQIENSMTKAHFAETAILRAASDLHIDLGGENAGDIDVSNAG